MPLLLVMEAMIMKKFNTDAAIRQGPLSTYPGDFLSEHIVTPDEILNFRDKVFPLLKGVDVRLICYPSSFTLPLYLS